MMDLRWPTTYNDREALYEVNAEVYRRPPRRPAEVLATMPYKAYLKSPEWRQTSRQKKNLANYRCEWCGRGENDPGRRVRLEVHHLHYRTRGFENLDEDLVCVCEDCHGTHHGF